MWRKIGSWLTGHENELLPFEDIRQRFKAQVQRDMGLRQVEIGRIVGSVGRYRDFDRAFLPSQVRTKSRWLSIDRAHYTDEGLPPVELYKLGETYFVKDGNHRVSVARERGQEFIDAYVVEVQAPVPITSLDDLEAWVRHQDALDFVTTTNLLRLRPEARIELTLPGQYEKLLEHIGAHRWYLGIQHQHPIRYERAVTSWYDQVYLPIVEQIRSREVLREFPGRTEADLYLWIAEHRWFLTQAGELDEDHPLDQLVHSFAQQFSERLTSRLKRAVRRRARSMAEHLLPAGGTPEVRDRTVE